MLSTTHIGTARKVIIGCLIGLLLVAGIWFWVAKYFEAFSDMSQIVSNNPLNQKVADSVKLSDDYQTKSTKILSDYLITTATTADLVTLSNNAQAELLNLTLPNEYKEKHLAEVLLLGEIADLAKAENETAAAKKITNLKELFETK
jgi:hypothetical protein